jgi:hypothetical protein
VTFASFDFSLHYFVAFVVVEKTNQNHAATGVTMTPPRRNRGNDDSATPQQG